MKRNLTDTAIKNAKPNQNGKAGKYGDGGGLYLLVKPSGAKLWRYKYRIAGKEKTLSIGAYSDHQERVLARLENDVVPWLGVVTISNIEPSGVLQNLRLTL